MNSLSLRSKIAKEPLVYGTTKQFGLRWTQTLLASIVEGAHFFGLRTRKIVLRWTCMSLFPDLPSCSQPVEDPDSWGQCYLFRKEFQNARFSIWRLACARTLSAQTSQPNFGNKNSHEKGDCRIFAQAISLTAHWICEQPSSLQSLRVHILCVLVCHGLKS